MLGARFRLEARILARSTEASQPARTVGVHLTLVRIANWYCEIEGEMLGLVTYSSQDHAGRLTLLAGKAGISRVSGRASARRPMVVNSALGTRRTIARISALFVLAGQMVRALVVPRTFGSRTTRQSVTSVAVDAVASCVVVVVSFANGIASTLGVSARVDAVLVHTGLRCRTVRIRSAPDFVASNLSVSGVAVAARTYSPMELYSTFGVQITQSVASRARIHALLVDASLVVGTLIVAHTFWLRHRIHLSVTLHKW